MEVLILGGGVGSLSQFLARHLNARVTNCELSEDVILVAKNFFGFVESDNEKMVCCDGLDYIDQVQNSKMFDCIIVDINCKDFFDSLPSANDKLSPPKEFLKREFLQKMGSALQDDGFMFINVIDSQKQLKGLDWDMYYSLKCNEDLNEVRLHHYYSRSTTCLTSTSRTGSSTRI